MAARILYYFAGATCFVGCLALSAAGCAELVGSENDTRASSEGNETTAAKPFVHELAGLQPVNGSYPIVDIQDAPSGRRYSMETGSSQACSDCPVVDVSGVFEREVERDESHPYTDESSAPTPVIEGAVVAMMARAPEAQIEVELLFDAPVLNVTRALERRVALGQVTTAEGMRAARREVVAERNEALRAFIDEKAEAVSALGAMVLETLPTLGRIRVKANRLQIDKLLPSLRRVVLSRADYGVVDGANMEFLREGHQLDQFINSGFDGERNGGSSDDFRIAFWEGGTDLPAAMDMFDDWSGGPSRVTTWCPSGSTCSVRNSASQHPNRVLSVGVGDLTQGQDSAITDTTSRINKSGIAHEAQATQYVGGWTGASAQMLTDAGDFEVAVVNSAGSATGSPTCQGNHADAIAADALFEAGVFVVGGAGNDGDSTECNVKRPKDAIGVFTTGGSLETSNSASGVRAGTLHSSSSVGGLKGSFSNTGRGRTIVDMTFNFGFTDRPNWDGTAYGFNVNGNSVTGPAVAAAAVNFSDWFEIGYGSSSLIGQPGKLFAMMLLMGDRENDGSKVLKGFNRRWGAGRLKMRKLDAAGLDTPYQWKRVTFCVGHGESVYYDLTPSLATNTDYDIIKGVIFWYDNRLEDGVAINNLNLTLQRSSNGTTWTDYRSGTSRTDNKERVFASDAADGEIGGYYWRWKVRGVNVNESQAGDPSGCTSSGEQRTHLVWLAEDSDRDDGDGPTATEIEPEG